MRALSRAAQESLLFPKESHHPTATRLTLALALVWVVGLFWALAPLPFFADDYSQLARAAEFGSAAEAFDLEQKIYRPLETLLYFVLNRTGLDRPWVGRLAPFGMHLGVGWLLFLLARRLGASSRAAALGVLLFAVAPNTRNLGWVVAHSTPSRAFLVLAGLLLFQKRRSRPLLAAVGTSLCLGVGLLFHTGAIVLPLLCALWVLVFDVEWSRRDLGAWTRTLVSPALLAQLLVTVGYVLFTLQLPNRYHGVHGLATLPASVVRVTTFALPEELRRVAVEGLRGTPGSLAFVLGAVLVLAILGLLAALVWRGPRAARFLILAAGVDLLPYVVSIGFSMRYAYLAFGFVALGLAVWVDSRRRLALALVPFLGLYWGFDTLRDVGEQRAGGRFVEDVIAVSREARERVGPKRWIALVDLPEVWGREQDITLMNWGTREALVRAGIGGPFALLRTTPALSSTEARFLEPAALEAFLAEHDALVIDWGTASQ